MPGTQVALTFSMRRPPKPDAPSSETLFREMLSMIAWSDDKTTGVCFGEHHVSGDGFTTSPLVLSAAALAATRQAHVGIMALLLPLHDPVRVAEQICNLDLLGGGRHRTILGLGYRPPEYQVFGVDWKARGRVFDECTRVVLALLRGESLDVRGVETRLDHLPASPVDRIVLMGGNSVRAARRAAEHRLGFIPAIGDPEIERVYREGCARTGYDGYYEVPNVGGYTLLSRDPDRTWAEIGDELLFDAMSYQNIAHTSRTTMVESDATSIQALRESGTYQVVTPEELLEQIEAGMDITLAPLVGGSSPEIGWETLELYASDVLPKIELSRGLFDHREDAGC